MRYDVRCGSIEEELELSYQERERMAVRAAEVGEDFSATPIEAEIVDLDQAIKIATEKRISVLSRWNGRRVRVSAAGRTTVIATEVAR